MSLLFTFLKQHCRFEVGLFDTPNPNSHTSDVTTKEHSQLARELSAASHVLLQNEENVLPISVDGPKKIALIGQAARRPIVAGGGSGRVIPKHVVSPHEGVMSYLGIIDEYPVSVECPSSAVVVNMTIGQGCWPSLPVDNIENCARECANDVNCLYYGFKNYDDYAWCTLYPTDYLIQATTDDVMLGTCTKSEPRPTWQCNADKICVATTNGADLDGQLIRIFFHCGNLLHQMYSFHSCLKIGC